MEIDVTYGDGKVKLKIPEKNLAGVIKPKQLKARPDTAAELAHAMTNPHGPMLSDMVRSKSVCVLVEDHTRDEPHWELLSAVVPHLRDANRVQFIVTTGSHEVNHPANLEIVEMITRAARDSRLDNFHVLIHDCNSSDMVHLGKTSRGTPVIANTAAVGHDVYVSISDMKAHYFAGYSNVVKNFLPGVCGFPSIEANHAMALHPDSTFGTHPFHPNEDRRNNPLADDMQEAMDIIVGNGKIFVLAVVSDGGKIVWVDAGEPEPVTARGIEVLDNSASFNVTPTDRIIVSPGGYPQDKSLYHAQRAIELTKNAVTDGGEILFLAECRDGVAPESAIENFYNKLKAPLKTVLSSISEKYHLYEHKAYKFAALLTRVSKVMMYTTLERDVVEAVHLDKVDNPQSVIDRWIAENNDVQILVLDKGNKISVQAA
ncbi:MAG: nickel-dependent lactate racemase [Candidatus Thorarchaeota archaeon]